MNYLIQFQLNIYALAILIILLVAFYIRTSVQSFTKQILRTTIVVTIVALIVEPLSWIFDGKQFFGAFFLEYTTNFLLFLIAPVIGGLMMSYVDYMVRKDRARVERRFYYMQWLTFTAVALIINFFSPIYFSVEMGTNSYSGGDFKWLHYVVIGSMYLYMVFFLFRNWKDTQRWMRYVFIIFFALPILGMVFQIMNSRLFFSWSSIVIGLLVVYMFFETTSGERNYLTRLYSRFSYELYATHLIERNLPFGVLLFDLDGFKDINDTYGHRVGDLVLIEFGHALTKTFHPNKMVARLAGDEFVVIIEYPDMTIPNYTAALQAQLARNAYPQVNTLSFSWGYQSYEEGMTLDQLYHNVDVKMYEQKNKKIDTGR